MIKKEHNAKAASSYKDKVMNNWNDQNSFLCTFSFFDLLRNNNMIIKSIKLLRYWNNVIPGSNPAYKTKINK